MTNAELLELVSSITGLDKDSLKNKVEVLTKLALYEIQEKAPWFWKRKYVDITLAAGESVRDLAVDYDDIGVIRFMYTSHTMLDYYSDFRYAREFPNGETAGSVDKYTPLDKTNIKFSPPPESSTVVNIAYYAKFGNGLLDSLDERYHSVVLFYILSFYLDSPKTGSTFYFNRYNALVQEMQIKSKQSEQQELALLQDDMQLSADASANRMRSR